MNEERIKIVSVEIVNNVNDIGKESAAAIPSHFRYRYFMPVVYIGENGQEFKSTIRALTKPKLKQKALDTQRYVDNGMMSYSRYGSGEWSQVISFSIGARGITACA